MTSNAEAAAIYYFRFQITGLASAILVLTFPVSASTIFSASASCFHFSILLYTSPYFFILTMRCITHVHTNKKRSMCCRYWRVIYPISMSLSGYATSLFIYFTSVLASVPVGIEV